MSFHYIGNYFLKIWEAIEHPKLWAIVTTVAIFFNQYVFSQWQFAFGFFLIFLMDTYSGVYVARRTKSYSGKIFRELLTDKCVAYFTIIISFSAATKVTLQGSDMNLIQYLNLPVYTLFIVVEFRSIVTKWYGFKKWAWLGQLLAFIDKNQKETIDKNLNASHE